MDADQSLERAALFVAGRSASARFIRGDAGAQRDLAPPAGMAAMLEAALHGPAGLRAILLEGIAAHHGSMGDGARGAGISCTVIEHHQEAAAGPAGVERDIARKGIASAATSFGYGALRAGHRRDVIGFADRESGRLAGWMLTDAARTLETQATLALLELDCIDKARARLPESPGDPPGAALWHHVRGKLVDPGPGGAAGPVHEKWSELLQQLSQLLALMRAHPLLAGEAGALEAMARTERDRAPPQDDRELLERSMGLMEALRRAQNHLARVGPHAFGQ